MSGFRLFAAFVAMINLTPPAVAQQSPACDSVAACRALAPDAAGLGLLRLLDSAHWDTRVEAAFALGGVDYPPAVPGLVQALGNAFDWQLVYAATVSLSRIGNPSAVQPLREVADDYWYPPVRTAAECAAQWIERGKPCDRQTEILDIDAGGLRAIGVDTRDCSKRPYPRVSEPAAMKQYGNEEAMELFKYAGAECALHGDVDQATGARSCLARRILYPQIAARSADGWFTGRDQGDIGGELMFFPDSGKPYKVLEANVEDVYVLEQGVLALAGLANETVNRGVVYQLRRDAAGQWQGEPVLRLPGAPESSYKISRREFVANAYGGVVVVDDHGKPRMALCNRK
jgi:hypothetical protein